MLVVVDQSPGPLLVDILNSISKRGEKVTLFYGSAKTGNKKIDSNVRLIRGIGYRRETLLLRLFTWVVFTLQYLFYLLFSKKPSVVLAITNPPFATFVTSWVAGLRNIPFCLLIYDLYPEALMHAQLGHRQSILFRIWAKFNRFFFNKANIVFTISDTMKKEISKYCKSELIQVIPNWADTDYIKPFPKSNNSFVQQFDLRHKYVVLYAGNCGLTHDLESVIEAASLLRDYREIAFIIAGNGAKKLKLENMAKDWGLKNINFLPYQDERNFPMLMAAADIGIVTLGAAAEAISVPSKTYTNLAAGLCLIAISHPGSELSEIISKYEVGVLCPPENPKKLAGILREIFSNEELLKNYKRNSRKAVANFTSQNADLYFQYLKPFL